MGYLWIGGSAPLKTGKSRWGYRLHHLVRDRAARVRVCRRARRDARCQRSGAGQAEAIRAEPRFALASPLRRIARAAALRLGSERGRAAAPRVGSGGAAETCRGGENRRRRSVAFRYRPVPAKDEPIDLGPLAGHLAREPQALSSALDRRLVAPGVRRPKVLALDPRLHLGSEGSRRRPIPRSLQGRAHRPGREDAAGVFPRQGSREVSRNRRRASWSKRRRNGSGWRASSSPATRSIRRARPIWRLATTRSG